jgi:hypothetical protein
MAAASLFDEFNDEDALYYSSSRCTFSEHKATVVDGAHVTLTFGGHAEREAALARTKPLAHLGQDYAKLVVPAIPVCDFVVSRRQDEKEEKEEEEEAESCDLPPHSLGSFALVKHRQGVHVGAHSGVRSAIVKDSRSGRFYRLKGCGNNYDGFTVRGVESSEDLIEIRGATFPWTCQLAQHMTARVGEALAPANMISANRPCGWWRYADVDGDRFPRVDKCCSIFETLGDRRAGDHLLVGAERLVRLLFSSADVASLDAVASQCFAPARLADGSTPMETHMIALMGADDFGGWARATSSEAIDALAKAIVDALPLEPPAEAFVGERWHSMWRASADALNRHANMAALLAALFWRVGCDAGVTLRLMHAASLSWGTYTDHLGTHCNAHVNNLVVLAKRHGRQLVAPLDFDMAYEREHFCLPIDAASVDEQFAAWRTLEKRGMEMCLAGSDLNSGASPVEELPERLHAIQWLLRDTACAAFNMAYASDKVGDDAAADDDAMQHLVRLCLMLTVDTIA